MEGGADEKLKVESTSKSTASILNLPPEIQFKIFELVEDPFDAICFGLVRYVIVLYFLDFFFIARGLCMLSVP